MYGTLYTSTSFKQIAAFIFYPQDLELEELRETIDRLESEKQDLVDEMRETKDQMNQLDAASEQVGVGEGENI